MIRTIIIVLLLLAYLILFIPVLILEWIIGKFNPRLRDITSLRLVQYTFKLMLLVSGVKLTVIGEENVPKDRAVLYIGNHRSYFDILLTYSRCPELTGFIAKKEMQKFPILNIWMKRLYCLFLDRENPKEGLKTILTAVQYVKDGISICIFPEGTRNKGEELSVLPFKDGAFKIAERTRCPIIPISMNNTIEMFEKHIPFVKKTHVVIEYGRPIETEGLTKKEIRELPEKCRELIQRTIEKNAALIP